MFTLRQLSTNVLTFAASAVLASASLTQTLTFAGRTSALDKAPAHTIGVTDGDVVCVNPNGSGTTRSRDNTQATPDLTKLKHTFLGGNSCDAKRPESVRLHQSELWSNDGDEWLRFDSNHDAPSDSWQTWGLRRSRD